MSPLKDKPRHAVRLGNISSHTKFRPNIPTFRINSLLKTANLGDPNALHVPYHASQKENLLASLGG